MTEDGRRGGGSLESPRAVLEALEERLRMRHASPRTVEAYRRWVRRFIRATGRRDPRALGRDEVTAFLSALATEERVSASTQNQALSALLFLYGETYSDNLSSTSTSWCTPSARRAYRSCCRVERLRSYWGA